MNVARPSVSFIVPALNEELHVKATVESIRRAVEGADISDYDIILVDDGSTDKTGSIMDQMAASDARLRILHNERNLGLGGAYKRGLAAAQCDYVMVVAGDNAATADSIRATINHLGEADIIIPYINNASEVRPLLRRIGSRSYTLLMNFLFGLNVKYYNGAIPRRELVNQISFTTNSTAFFAEMTLKLVKSGCSYVEVGIKHTRNAPDHSAALHPKHLLTVFKAIGGLFLEMRRSRPGLPLVEAKSPPAVEK